MDEELAPTNIFGIQKWLMTSVKSKDFDESLLEANLEKTVEQRITIHDAALQVALEFQKAGQKLYKGGNKAVQKQIKSHGIR